ncbi:MAG: hypothetical protein RL258_491 [Pseudomonadota bacterium]
MPEYPVPVLNERAIRAAAGILFFFAMVSFMNAWLMGNFAPTRVFVVAFLIDFTIRLFVNPHYAPSMVIGQWLVRRQQPEWTGAPQKRFAWFIGFLLALTMLYLVVIQGVIGPINLVVCGLCLLLMFFESAFGICIGCWLYNRMRPDIAQLCPGGACEYTPDSRERLTIGQVVVFLVFLGVMVFVAPSLAGRGHTVTVSTESSPATLDPAEEERCKVPEFAKAIGHEEKWKLHNNCK